MSNKPREFTLCKTDSLGIFEAIEITIPRTKLKHEIHVIEYSAYEALLKQHLSIESIGPLALQLEAERSQAARFKEALETIQISIKAGAILNAEHQCNMVLAFYEKDKK